MSKTSANAPCPCGSGKKYKRCCMGLKTSDVKSMLAGSEASHDDLDDADDHERGGGGIGIGQAMTDFAQPLIDVADTHDKMQKALALGSFFWNLSVLDDDKRKESFDAFFANMQLPEKDREPLWRMALQMVERHRLMFPRLHERKG